MPVVTGSVTAVFSGILLVIAQIKPSGSTRFLDFNAAGSIIYYHGDRSATFATAESFCKALGGRLPISINELQTFALRNPAYKIEEFWLGPVKQQGSIYMWPNGAHLNHYHFYYDKWDPQPTSCEQMCCAITGNLATNGNTFSVKPRAEVPCHTFRKPLCVIVSTPGATVLALNETLKEFHSGYKKILQKMSSFDLDRRKLQIAFNSVKKDLDENKDLWKQLETNNATVFDLPQKKVSDNLSDYIFTNEETGRRYFFNGTLKNLLGAGEFCKNLHGALPMIKNESDGHYLKSLVGMFSLAWLGSIKQVHQLDRYTWSDLSKVTIPYKQGYPKCVGISCGLAVYYDMKKDYLIDLDSNNYANVICDITVREEVKPPSHLDEKINYLKNRLSIQRKAMGEIIKSFHKFISNAPATGALFG